MYTLSIFKYLLSLKQQISGTIKGRITDAIVGEIPDKRLFLLSNFLTCFKYDNIIYLLEVITDVFSKKNLRVDIIEVILQYTDECRRKANINEAKEELIEITTDNFNILKDRLNFFKINPTKINFKIVPLAGLVICPERRYIAIIGCKSKSDSEITNRFSLKWFHFRVLVN